jgi:hypothetical protein
MIRKLRPVFEAERACDEKIAQAAAQNVRGKILAGEVVQNRGWDWRRLVWPLHPIAAAMACALLLIGFSILMLQQTSTPATHAVYVSFAADQSGKGTADQPINSLGRGASAVRPGGTVNLKPGATAESIRIDKPMRLVATDGQVRIGKL